MFIELNEREHATILAALRYWQRKGILGPTKPHCLAEYDIAANEGKVNPLDADEIDALCERVNCEESTLPAKLLGSLQRALEASENPGKDYGWNVEAERIIKIAKKAGIKPENP